MCPVCLCIFMIKPKWIILTISLKIPRLWNKKNRWGEKWSMHGKRNCFQDRIRDIFKVSLWQFMICCGIKWSQVRIASYDMKFKRSRRHSWVLPRARNSILLNKRLTLLPRRSEGGTLIPVITCFRKDLLHMCMGTYSTLVIYLYTWEFSGNTVMYVRQNYYLNML